MAPKPFDVLCRLVERPGELVTKDELLDDFWPNLNVTESSLSYTINAIRIALGDNAQAARYIETVTQRGYRFIAPVTVVSPPEGPPEGKALVPPSWPRRAPGGGWDEPLRLRRWRACCSRASPAIVR